MGCKTCPDTYVDRGPTEIDSIGLKLAQIYVAPRYRPGVHPLANVRGTMPFDTKQRTYPKPIFHPNGDIEYPRLEGLDIEPDEIEGYERTENPWRFRPVWPDCEKRFHSAQLKDNGCIKVAMLCQNPDSPHNNNQVSLHDCSNCPVRRQHDQSSPALTPPVQS